MLARPQLMTANSCANPHAHVSLLSAGGRLRLEVISSKIASEIARRLQPYLADEILLDAAPYVLKFVAQDMWCESKQIT